MFAVQIVPDHAHDPASRSASGNELVCLSIAEMAAGIVSGKFRSRQLVEAHLARMDLVNSGFGA